MQQTRTVTPGLGAGTPVTSVATSAAPCRIWVDDPATFSASRIGAIRHDFHRHPLMQLQRLAELAEALVPTGQCRFITPGSKQASVFFHSPNSPDGKTIQEVFRRVEEPGSWIALYNIQTNPTFSEFLQLVPDGLRPLIAHEQPGILGVGGFIFISAPPSAKPFHVDCVNISWLQIHGHRFGSYEPKKGIR
jgi:hypothetical protein